MKKITLLFTFLLCSIGLFAGKTLPSDIEQLPTNAQKMIKTHFPKSKIVKIVLEEETFESKVFDVRFEGDYTILFDHKGNWFLVDCIKDPVPTLLVPAEITKYIVENFPGDHITQIEVEKSGYEVELESDLAIRFDKKGKVRF